MQDKFKTGDVVRILDIHHGSDKFSRKEDFIGKEVVVALQLRTIIEKSWIVLDVHIGGTYKTFWGVKVELVTAIKDGLAFKKGDRVRLKEGSVFFNESQSEGTIAGGPSSSDWWEVRWDSHRDNVYSAKELALVAPPPMPSTSHITNTVTSSKATFLTTNKETTMIKLENKPFINGIDSANVTDDQVFTAIANQESEVDRLNRIDNQPQTLIDRIASMRKGVADLVAFVDQRTKDNK